ncbi:MAG: hypothetical protein GY937_19950 [bacterium]|nr:hypothetical protein [bacterium]
MAVTWAFSKTVESVMGNKRVIVGTLSTTGNASYTSGGDTFNAATLLGLTNVDHVIGGRGYYFEVDNANNKLLVYAHLHTQVSGNATAVPEPTGSQHAALTASTVLTTFTTDVIFVGF